MNKRNKFTDKIIKYLIGSLNNPKIYELIKLEDSEGLCIFNANSVQTLQINVHKSRIYFTLFKQYDQEKRSCLTIEDVTLSKILFSNDLETKKIGVNMLIPILHKLK